jgi:SAM-dependent methyltransferase
MDWGVGRYETIATGLLPAAERLVELAAPQPGERVLDVGCGTGSAALCAAARGASATGVDPSEPLLQIARSAAAERGLEASFLAGRAEELPLADGSAEVVVSAFGVIFTTDALAAAGEMARVSTPQGRIALSAWIPEGALARVMRARGEALGGPAPAAPAFAWHDAGALSALLEPHGFAVTTSEHELAFVAASPRDFAEREFADHPAWVTARDELEPRGEWDALREQALAILSSENEDTEAFRVTSRYVIAQARRA